MRRIRFVLVGAQQLLQRTGGSHAQPHAKACKRLVVHGCSSVMRM